MTPFKESSTPPEDTAAALKNQVLRDSSTDLPSCCSAPVLPPAKYCWRVQGNSDSLLSHGQNFPCKEGKAEDDRFKTQSNTNFKRLCPGEKTKQPKNPNTKNWFIVLCSCRSYLVRHKNMPWGGILQIPTLELWICTPSLQRNCTNHTDSQPLQNLGSELSARGLQSLPAPHKVYISWLFVPRLIQWSPDLKRSYEVIQRHLAQESTY